jgi:putative NADH-flavin reductase
MPLHQRVATLDRKWCGHTTENPTLHLLKEFPMKVFVTGATGFIGSAIVRELIEAGHQVLGLARSDAAEAKVTSAGAEVHRGALDDLDSLRSGAAASDGVIHTAFMHDFARAPEMDLHAIETIGAALEGSGRPFVVASGIFMLAMLGRLVTEEDMSDPAVPRVASENAMIALSRRGVASRATRSPGGSRPGSLLQDGSTK